MDEIELQKIKKLVINALKRMLDDRAILASKCMNEFEVKVMGRKAILKIEVEFLE